MTGLPVISGKELIKTLVREGFVIRRQKGSHIRLIKYTTKNTLKITVPFHNEIDRGTLIPILNSANIPKEDFIKFI